MYDIIKMLNLVLSFHRVVTELGPFAKVDPRFACHKIC